MLTFDLDGVALFGCFDLGIEKCLIGYICPAFPLTVTRTTLEDRPFTWCECLCPANPYVTRQSIRAKFGMPADDLGDFLTAICCGPCFQLQNVGLLAKKKGGEPKVLPDKFGR